MLLIVFMCLGAKLALVWGDCEHGIPALHDFDYTKFSGPRPWYVVNHNNDSTEHNFDCVRATYASPEGNRSEINCSVYDKSEHVHKAIHGYISKWNSTGHFQVSTDLPMWNGIFQVLAVDYDSYCIAYHCGLGTQELSLYVLYRSHRPDQETVNEVHRVMQDKNIDASQLVDWSADHCL